MHPSDEWINGLVGSICKKTLAKKIYTYRDASNQRAETEGNAAQKSDGNQFR